MFSSSKLCWLPRPLKLAFFLLICFAVAPATRPLEACSLGVPIQADRGNPDAKVWVNTNSGIYHCPGTKWYGRTKNGLYMTQAEAQKKGYRPAYGKVCR